MTLAEKLRFLADRAEDGKPFSIDEGNYVFDKNTLRIEGGSSIFAINDIKFADLKLKPTWEFTEDEKVILRNLPEEFRWIARDKISQGLFVYTSKPTKSEQSWLGNVISLIGFQHVFKSIQWSDEEPCEFRKYI